MLSNLRLFARSFNKIHIRSLSNFSLPENKNVKILPITHVTNGEAIDKDYGLKSFLNKTYICTSGGILTSMGGGMVVAHNPEILQYFPYMTGFGFLTSIAGCFGMSFTKYNIHTTRFKQSYINKTHHNVIHVGGYLQHPHTNYFDSFTDTKQHVKSKISNNEYQVVESYHSENTPERIISYTAVIGGMTLITSPLLAYAHMTDILMPAMLSTGLVFGGAMHYAKTRKIGELEAWGSALHGGLWGIIGCGLTGIGSTLLFGPNIFSAFMHSIDLYAGIPLFAGFVAYDTHKAIELYNQKDPDHLGCSLNLYLDFMNILVRMIEIMAKLQKKD